jgi:restriction endonuclease S subunit
MIRLSEIAEIISGTPQFRITKSSVAQVPEYIFYSQTDLSDNLVGLLTEDIDNKRVRTKDNVNTLCTGDVVFSLISGTAAIVREEHNGYLYTQNYVKLIPNETINPKFFVYLLNKNKVIKKQLLIGLQGSQVMKYTLKQLKELEIPLLPHLERQKVIGKIYFDQLRLQALKNRAVTMETKILFYKLEEEAKND